MKMHSFYTIEVNVLIKSARIANKRLYLHLCPLVQKKNVTPDRGIYCFGMKGKNNHYTVNLRLQLEQTQYGTHK